MDIAVFDTLDPKEVDTPKGFAFQNHLEASAMALHESVQNVTRKYLAKRTRGVSIQEEYGGLFIIIKLMI